MTFKSQNLLILLFYVSCLISVAEALETDDAYHIENVKSPDFEKADKNKDGVVDSTECPHWHWFKRCDLNQDGKVDFSEYANHYDDPAASRILRNIVYKTATGQKCLMDIYIPAKQKLARAPVFYYTHGGGWAAGNKDPVVMSDCVTDAKHGLRFLRKHALELGIDAARVMPFGLSAGGHIALMLTYIEPADFLGDPGLADFNVQPVGGINWFGPSDFTITDLFVPAVEDWAGNPDRFTPRMRKGSGALSYQQADDELKAIMRKLSPVYYLKKDRPPVLTIHGDQDTTIPQKHSFHLSEKAGAIGCPVTFIPVKGAGHGWHKDCAPNADEISAAMVDFAVKHLIEEAM